MILLLEDDQVIASGLCYILQNEGHEVLHCVTLAAAREALRKHTFTLAVLDLGLPDGSGFAVCQTLKETSPATAVIFLTAEDGENEIVEGFSLGADDYITKPFSVRELVARIRAVLRRSAAAGQPEPEAVALGEVLVYPGSGRVARDGRDVSLTALEYRLLVFFARHKGQLLTRDQLLENLWDVDGSFVNDNTLTVYIKRLRDKLGEEVISTVRGLGYTAGGKA